jgi:hypothetical protein
VDLHELLSPSVSPYYGDEPFLMVDFKVPASPLLEIDDGTQRAGSCTVFPVARQIGVSDPYTITREKRESLEL